jgi:outer membrane protein assembly factor BamB
VNPYSATKNEASRKVKSKHIWLLFPIFAAVISVQIGVAEDWPTFGHDPWRSGASEEHILSPQNVGGLQLKWASQMDNLPLALNSLTAPIVVSNVTTDKGIKTLVYVAGSSDTFFALDADDGKVVWNRTFNSVASPANEPFYLCPDAVNATPVVDEGKKLVYTIARDGKLYGLDLGSGAVKFGPFQFIPAFAKPWSLNLRNGLIYTSTSQACGGDRSGLYSMDVNDAMHPVVRELLIRKGFGGGMWNRGGVVIGRNHRLYTSTGDGGFDPNAGDFGSTFIAADPETLHVLDYFTPSNWSDINKHDLDLPSGGMVGFRYKHEGLIAGGGKEAILYLLSEKSLGGKDHHTPVDLTRPLANDDKELEQKGMWGAPAVWFDPATGEIWLYVTIWGPVSKTLPNFPLTNGDVPHGCIMAFNVVRDSKTHKPSLRPTWISPDFNLPDGPIVTNGVLLALSTGENPRQQHVQGLLHYNSKEEWKKNLLTNEERGMGTHPAVLYALDAKTGKLLYQSGQTMQSWVHFSGLATSNGRVYAVDHSSRVYCFALNEEQNR